MTQEQFNRIITLHEQKAILESFFEGNDTSKFERLRFENYLNPACNDVIFNTGIVQIVIESLKKYLEEINTEIAEL